MLFFECDSETDTVQAVQKYCICFYDTAVWANVKVCALNKLKSAYARCLKLFFNFPKYCSVNDTLLQLGVPSFNTVLHNASWNLFWIV